MIATGGTGENTVYIRTLYFVLYF